MPSPIELALSSLLPTLSPLPIELIDLATSLLAQSRSRASSLKAEEEIGRTYAVCHIACERLGKKLALEIGKPAPPVQPRVYQKLKTYLGSTLRTPITPRSRRVEDKLVAASTVKTPTRSSAQATPTKSAAVTPATARKETGSSARHTPVKGLAVAPLSGGKRKVDATEEPEQVDLVASAPVLPTETAEDDDLEVDNDEEDEDAPPVKRPAKTPLRRKEKHAKFDDGWEDLGAAGLLPGLGTMFQPAVDWLSDERRAEYALWENGIMREMAVIERQQAA
ncbi:hypothetical protein LTR36_010329 [Oleoguttula mirabilis]|uniref:ORC6 first cyclin-like domain-containing protein n=1 Tax=Oleoguttula mirabilis TaxID=1507867 RepID=A0AAV9J4C6_9PEZI|nr:hypothetical protein LTR36_010329 [Oleoguttula mirabilis]